MSLPRQKQSVHRVSESGILTDRIPEVPTKVVERFPDMAGYVSDMETWWRDVREVLSVKMSDLVSAVNSAKYENEEPDLSELIGRISALERKCETCGDVSHPGSPPILLPPAITPPPGTIPPGTVDPKAMRYKDDLPASALPTLPDPNVKYGDAWRISVAGTNHGITWSVGDLAVVGAGNTYDRVGGEPYRPDLVVEAFSVSPTSREVGNDLSQVVFSWRYNRDDIAAQTITGTGLPTQNPDPATTPPFTWVATITSTTTFRLTATDSTGDSASRTATTTFKYMRFWGTNPKTTVTDADLQAMSGELSTTQAQTKFIVPAGNYMYLAWPAAWGLGRFYAGGLPDTSWVLQTRDVTNPYGVTASYHIYRSAQSPDGTEPIEIEVRTPIP